MTTTLTRETTSRIVGDLARATRSVPEIAHRYRTTEAAVVALREHYGPEIPALIASAKILRRPAKPTTVKPTPMISSLPDSPQPEAAEPEAVDPEPEAPDVPVKRRGDGLTQGERVDCRTWCAATGREVGAFGMIPRGIVEAWDAAGRPVLVGVVAPDEDVVDVEIVDEGPDLVEVIRRAAGVLQNILSLVPFAAEHAPTELEAFLRSASDLTLMLRRSRDAQVLIERAQTALKRIGVDVSAASARQLLHEIEVL